MNRRRFWIAFAAVVFLASLLGFATPANSKQAVNQPVVNNSNDRFIEYTHAQLYSRLHGQTVLPQTTVESGVGEIDTQLIYGRDFQNRVSSTGYGLANNDAIESINGVEGLEDDTNLTFWDLQMDNRDSSEDYAGSVQFSRGFNPNSTNISQGQDVDLHWKYGGRDSNQKFVMLFFANENCDPGCTFDASGLDPAAVARTDMHLQRVTNAQTIDKCTDCDGMSAELEKNTWYRFTFEARYAGSPEEESVNLSWKFAKSEEPARFVEYTHSKLDSRLHGQTVSPVGSGEINTELIYGLDFQDQVSSSGLGRADNDAIESINGVEGVEDDTNYTMWRLDIDNREDSEDYAGSVAFARGFDPHSDNIELGQNVDLDNQIAGRDSDQTFSMLFYANENCDPGCTLRVTDLDQEDVAKTRILVQTVSPNQTVFACTNCDALPVVELEKETWYRFIFVADYEGSAAENQSTDLSWEFTKP